MGGGKEADILEEVTRVKELKLNLYGIVNILRINILCGNIMILYTQYIIL